MQIDRQQLYLATIAQDAAALAQAYGLGLELNEFCTAANLDGPARAEWAGIMTGRMAASDRFILHAPFAELSPAAIDPLISRVSRYRLEQAYALAAAHGIKRMVVHSGFVPRHHYPEWFVAQAPGFWRDFLADKAADFQLLLENVQEPEPYLLTQVVQAVADARLGSCLDIGHAAVYSRLPLAKWLEALKPAHFHIHNNDGQDDLHAPLDQGCLDMGAFLRQAARDCPAATYTIETMEAGTSLDWLLAQGLLGK